MTTERSLEDKRRMLADLLLDRHRQQFPTVSRLTYLNYGVQGLLSTPARETLDQGLRRLDELAPYSTDALLERRQEVDSNRAFLAAELGGDVEGLSLVESTSVAMNIVLWGTPWQAGDRIVVTNHEYPGAMAAVRQVAQRFDLQIVEWNIDGDDSQVLADLEPLLAPPSRLVLVSHIPWDTGRILPLADIAERCRSLGAGRVRLLVDGAQSAGVLPLKLKDDGIDYFAFTGHKWWCGPEGAGGLYVDPAILPQLHSTFVGPRSLAFLGAAGFGDLQQTAARFEVSSSCVALHSALRVAIETRHQWGPSKACLERLRQLSSKVWQGLAELESGGVERLQSAPPEAGLIFFRVAGHTALDVARFLEARGVLIRGIPHSGYLRVSVHYLTLDREIEAFFAALREFLQRPVA